jgi:hypothetical protein
VEAWLVEDEPKPASDEELVEAVLMDEESETMPVATPLPAASEIRKPPAPTLDSRTDAAEENIPVVLPVAQQPAPTARPVAPPAGDVPYLALPRAADVDLPVQLRAVADGLADLEPPPEVLALGRPERVFRQISLLEAALELPGPWLKAVLPSPEWLFGGIGAGLAGAGLVMFLIMAVVPWEARSTVFLLGLSGMLLGGGLIVAAWHHAGFAPRFTYAIYRDALACMQHEAWTVVPWAEVVSFHGYYNLGSRASLLLRDGCELQLAGVFSRCQLSKEVERRLFPVLLQRAVTALENGKTVLFGPVGVSHRGLTYKGKSVEWSEVVRIDLMPPNQGAGGVIGGLAGALAAVHVRLMITRYGENPSYMKDWHRWCDEPFPLLPNRAVLLKLLHTLRPQHVPMAVARVLGVFMPALF